MDELKEFALKNYVENSMRKYLAEKMIEHLGRITSEREYKHWIEYYANYIINCNFDTKETVKMTKTTEKVLKSFSKSNEKSVSVYIVNSQLMINEINESIKELIKENIYPQFTNVDGEVLELNFVKQ